MKTIFTLLLVFAIAWCAFAFHDFSGQDDLLKVYRLIEVKGSDPSNPGKKSTKYVNDAFSEYRISQGKILSKVGSFVNEYDNCTIFDIENWQCTFSDESATFGAADGIYFSRSNTVKFPHLAGYQEPITVLRFRVVLNNCERQLSDGLLTGIVSCALAPFIL